MFFYEGLTCPVCQKPFDPSDDIVACPHCGLPHHRSCWIQEGHCHLEHLHNTDEQWSRAKATAKTVESQHEPVRESVSDDLPHQICSRCHTQNPEYAEFCKHCGQSLKGNGDWSSAEQAHEHAYGEYQPFRNTTYCENPNEEFNGIKAEHIAAVVGTKNEYYLPRFRRMVNTGRNTSWNWAAFIFGPLWLLYRKMYVSGALMLTLQLFQTIVTSFVYSRLGITDAATYEDVFRMMETAMSNMSNTYYILAVWLLSVLVFSIEIILAVYGNRLYFNHCANTVYRSRLKTPDLTAGELTSIGGTTIAMAIIGYLIQYFITQIVAIFFM